MRNGQAHSRPAAEVRTRESCNVRARERCMGTGGMYQRAFGFGRGRHPWRGDDTRVAEHHQQPRCCTVEGQANNKASAQALNRWPCGRAIVAPLGIRAAHKRTWRQDADSVENLAVDKSRCINARPSISACKAVYCICTLPDSHKRSCSGKRSRPSWFVGKQECMVRRAISSMPKPFHLDRNR